MDVSKKINEMRYSLSQDNNNQIIVKKEKEIILVQNLDYKLDTNDAFNILTKISSGKSYDKNKQNEEKLNIEEENVKLTPHPCLFCGCVPKVIDLKPAENSGAMMRTLQCTGLNCASNIVKSESGETKVTYKRWVYAVDVVDSVEKADNKLIAEWNRRMPLKGAK